MNVYLPPRDTVHALALQRFAFLLEQGFVLQPEEKTKRRLLAELVHYRREQWEVVLYLEYRDGYYTVTLVPLVDGKRRPGYPSEYNLLQYLPKLLGIEDEEVTRLATYQSQSRPFAEMVTVEYADDVLTRYAQLLARYLEQIMAAPHPPVGRE